MHIDLFSVYFILSLIPCAIPHILYGFGTKLVHWWWTKQTNKYKHRPLVGQRQTSSVDFIHFYKTEVYHLKVCYRSSMLEKHQKPACGLWRAVLIQHHWWNVSRFFKDFQQLSQRAFAAYKCFYFMFIYAVIQFPGQRCCNLLMK